MPLWTRDDLRQWVRGHHGGEQVVVLANREPFSHDRAPDGRIVVTHSTSGLVTALEPLVRATGGVWIGHGSGTADSLTVEGGRGISGCGMPSRCTASKNCRGSFTRASTAGAFPASR